MRLWSGVLLALTMISALLTPAQLPSGSGPASSVPMRLVAQSSGVLELSPAATCPVRGDFEGQFTDSSEMPVFLECVLGGVEQWIDVSYSGMPHPRAYYFVQHGYEGSYGCEYNSVSLQYCPGPQSVFLGEDAVWEQYRGHGDAAPVVVLAHEVTHHFQFMSQMRPAQTPNEQIRYENQADCGAGAFMNFAEAQGMLNGADDLRDLAGSLAAAAEAESIEQQHGTIEERLQSFSLGFQSTLGTPLAECNGFVPERAIINMT
jgi:uncharacterized protein